ncbi:FxSxx-COOH system tetratricopeptide repeat protein [Actinomadura sp. 6N118]|uniref:FxSxx-COOH system tetratricopeptide repeat protein n=1 Tax=Actinomadura sp. 6N118 TaxID=3375151 RepID=UPI0037B92347
MADESDEAINADPTDEIRAWGDRSPAVGTNHGVIITGDGAQYTTVTPVPFPLPENVRPRARVITLPRPATRVFVGREDALAQLTEALEAPGHAIVAQVVHGMSGAGKSELALQYVHRYQQQYSLVWWTTAESLQHVQTGLAKLARFLAPDGARMATTEEAAGWAAAWLRAHPGWLLVLDNVTDPAHIAGLLGSVANGRVVITSRRDVRWPGVTNTLHLELLDPSAAADLIADITGHTDPASHDSARAIAEELGFLPLALDQAAAYILQTRIGLDDYLRRLRLYPEHCYAAAAHGDKAQSTIIRLWDLTLRSLLAQAPYAVTIARVLAHYAPEEIPRHLVGGQSEDLTAQVDDALGALASHSMITLTGQAVTMHRLTQAAVLSQTTPLPTNNTIYRDTALSWLNRAMPANPQSNLDGWATWRSLLPHIDALSAHHIPNHETGQLGLVLKEAARFLISQGEYQRAHTMLSTAAAIAESISASTSPDLAIRLGDIAVAYCDLGRPADALPLFERAFAIAESDLPPDDPNLAILLGDLAATHRALGRPSDALPLDRRALAITEGALEPEPRLLAIRLGNLAATYRALGAPVDALPLEHRALVMIEAAFEPNSPEVAIRLGNLGATYCDLGRADKALPLFERALAITESAFGSVHPTLAVNLGNLAVTYCTLGLPRNALLMARRAVAIVEAAHGPEHPTLAIRLGSLAIAYCDLGQITDALPLFERAITIAEGALGSDYPDLETCLSNRAIVQCDLGWAIDFQEAITQAADRSLAIYGANHPATQSFQQLSDKLRDLYGATE